MASKGRPRPQRDAAVDPNPTPGTYPSTRARVRDPPTARLAAWRGLPSYGHLCAFVRGFSEGASIIRSLECEPREVDNVAAMPNNQRITSLLGTGLQVAWGSHAFWKYRGLMYGAVFLGGIAAIAFAGVLWQMFGFGPAALLTALGAGTLILLVKNGVVDLAELMAVETEHVLLLAELAAHRETPTGHEQIVWVRTRAAMAGAPPGWIRRRMRGAMTAIHGTMQDVGEAFPAFRNGRAPSWARWLLARCKNPMADVLAGRAFAEGTGHTSYRAKEGLLLYAAAWPEVFRLNVTLGAVGHAFALATAAVLTFPMALAGTSSPFPVLASLAAIALWSGFGVKRVFLDPILEGAAIIAFEERVRGISVPPKTEAMLMEASAAFRELDERVRDESSLG